MSDVRTLADKLKAAQEVASLASTDRLMAVDAEGNLKRIGQSLGRLKDIQSPQGTWMRIGYGAGGGVSSSVLFLIAQSWSNDLPGSALIAVSMSAADWGANNNPQVRVLSSINISRFSKIRILVPSASTSGKVSYIDIYQNSRNPKNTISIVGSLNFTADVSANAEIPEGYTAIERDLASCVLAVNSGGGKTLSFNQLCNFAERRVA